MDSLQDAAPPPIPPPPVPPPEVVPASGSYQVRCTGSPPQKTKHAAIRGKAMLVVAPGQIGFAGKAGQPGKAVLAALGLTILTGFLVHAMAAACGCGVGPGFLIWMIIMDSVLKRDVLHVAYPPSGRVIHDSHGRRTSIETSDGRWVTFHLHGRAASMEDELLRSLRSMYGLRFEEASLPRLSVGEKVALWIFVILIAGSLLGGIIYALTVTR